MTIKKRFIAEAICPKCKQMDVLMMISAQGSSYVECVECGYVQHEPKGESQQPGLIATFDPNKE